MTQAGNDSCTRILTQVARSPLGLCPDFPRIAEMWEDWWRFEAKRPLLRAAAPKRADIRWDKAFDLLDRPDEWVRVRRAQVENTHRVGEEAPFARVDLGPLAVAAFLGAPLHFAPEEQTSWQDPIIEDWDRPPSFALDESNIWYQRVLALHRALAKDAAGKYLVCFPDLGGSLDVLANLRGTERLCTDLYTHRETIRRAAMDVVDAWETVHRTLYEIVTSEGAGVVQWVGAWSEKPYAVPTCDFNALIGPADFAAVCLPSLSEQGRRAGRTIFHLDGPDAARHADALTADPNITAIQYVTGVGRHSALDQIGMFRRVQAAGKPLLINSRADEVEALAEALDPRGLAFMPYDVRNADTADRLMRIVESRSV